MKLFLIIGLSLCFSTVNAQLFAGLGGMVNFFDPKPVSDLELNLTAGYFIKNSNKFHVGAGLIYEKHNYGLRSNFAPIPFKAFYSYARQTGLTPFVFIGPTIDKHLSVGIMAGYEILTEEYYWDEGLPQAERVNEVKLQFDHARPTINAYAMINVFPDWKFSPMLNSRYGVFTHDKKLTQELALSICVLYNHKKKVK